MSVKSFLHVFVVEIAVVEGRSKVVSLRQVWRFGTFGKLLQVEASFPLSILVYHIKSGKA